MQSFFFFFFWFMWIAGANVVPQFYFLNVAAEQKESLTALLLILGSTSSIAGLLLGGHSAQRHTSPKIQQRLITIAIVLTIGCFSGFYLQPTIFLFYLIYLVFRLLSCFSYQYADSHIVSCSSTTSLAKYNQTAMLFMFIAITFSPLFFAYVNSPLHISLLLTLLGIITIFSLWPALKLTDTKSSASPPKKAVKFSVLIRVNASFIAYCSFYLSIIYLTGALLIYFIRDYYGIEHAVHFGGWVMLVTSASAAIACVIRMKYWSDHQLLVVAAKHQFWIIGLQVCAISLLYLKLSVSLWYLCLCTSLMGVAYGVFMLSTRQWASQIAASKGNSFLALYNLLPHICTMGVFIGMGVCSLLSDYSALDFYHLVALLITLLALGAVVSCYRLVAVSSLVE